MNYIELTIGSEVYKLRLTVRNCVAMEKALGCNPIEMLIKIEDGVYPKLNDMLIMLQYMLASLNHSITLDRTYDIFDAYLADGHNMFDIIPVFVEVFQASGLLGTESNEEIANTDEIKN